MIRVMAALTLIIGMFASAAHAQAVGSHPYFNYHPNYPTPTAPTKPVYPYNGGQTVLTPYGTLLHNVPGNQITMNFNNGQVYYRGTNGIIGATNGYYGQRIGNMIVSNAGTGYQFDSGYLAPNGTFYSNNAPWIVMGGDPRGPGFITPNAYVNGLYPSGNMQQVARYEAQRRAYAQQRYYDGLPDQYKRNPVMPNR